VAKANRNRDVHGIRVGKAKTHPEAPAHHRGTSEGNSPSRRGAPERRSTGIRSTAHDVIDPKMPKISPA
jgi:hypothetical protein